jgi:phytoene dehydrogenase-like protein
MLKMLPLMPFVMKWARFPFGEYGNRFKNPFLREAFGVLTEDIADYPAMGLFSNIAWYGKGITGYPISGSMEFARAIERRYLDLGGEVHYDDRVVKILTEADPSGRGDRAVGVRLEPPPGRSGPSPGQSFCRTPVAHSQVRERLHQGLWLRSGAGYGTAFLLLLLQSRAPTPEPGLSHAGGNAFCVNGF